MSDTENPEAVPKVNLLEMTADIVSAYVSINPLQPGDLPTVIGTVHAMLSSLTDEKGSDEPTPAVSVRRSVTPDYLVCLEDGRKLKLLKRHLRTTYDMSPDDYRKKWGLSADYPMVAPDYAKARSHLARKMGLGRKPSR